MTMPQDPNGSTGGMNHDLHDVDLVAAYALDYDDVDRDAAGQLVADCPECRSEFDNQRAVTSWLTAASVVALGDDERAALHARVDAAIARPKVVALPDRRHRRQPGQILFRIGAAAAALAVVAGLGGVFNRIGGDDGGGSVFQTEASEIAGASAESTTAASPTTTTADMFAAASAERTMLAGGDAAAVQREVEELIARASSPEEAGAPSNSQADAMTSVAECSDQIGDREILVTAESQLDGEPIIVFAVAGVDAEEEVEALVFRLADCSSVDLG
jgi:hypothetical protein